MNKVKLNSQFEVTNMILSLKAKTLKLTLSERAVLIQLSSYVDSSMVCYPTTKTLAEKVGVTERTAQSAIKKLSSVGYIDVRKFKCRDTGYWRNAYKLNVDNLPSEFKPEKKTKADVINMFWNGDCVTQ